MLPIHIHGCFSVLHPAAGRRGVLICGPLGDEALNSYRSLVFLGETLAAAGFPTLRLQYHGTADSAGTDDDPGRFERWLHDIRTAVTWLQTECGADAVTVIGVRIGAALAMRAVHDAEVVDSLVLLLPISGPRFLNELTMAARITQRVWQTTSRTDDGTWFEAHGVRIARETRDPLKKLDFQLPRPGTEVLVIEASESPATKKLVERIASGGAIVSFETREQIGWTLRDSHLAEIPHESFSRIVAWIGRLGSGGAEKTTGGTRMFAGGGLNLGFAREVSTNFGHDETLFGMLCIPAQPRHDAPTVLLVNTSANPRHGNARIAVDVARRLSVEGIASLRMDASGMGDSAASTGELGLPYSERTTEDVCHGIAELYRRFDRPVVALGICSGAYHALQAGFRDARIGGLVLINLQRFVWRDGDPSDAMRRTALRPTRFYLRHLLDIRSWRRLAWGDFDALNLARVLALRLAQRVLASLDPIIAPLAGGATRVGRIRRSVRALGLRGVPMLYVLGQNDPGLEELAAYFGGGGRQLRRQRNVTFRLLPDSDHMLSAFGTRALLIDELVDWLRREFLSVTPEMKASSGPVHRQTHAHQA